MRSLPNSPSKEHRDILDERLASYRAGKSKVISIEELMRRVRAEPKDATPVAVPSGSDATSTKDAI